MQGTPFDLESPNSSKLYISKNRTELGAIYQTIDWLELTKLFPVNASGVGSLSRLPIQGYFGLMILKHYLGSAEKVTHLFSQF